ncbi:MAG: imidazole glycerol phosphate synthase subunit HisF [Deltaproteobacteria bacterium]|nr:imidazole glycerol phosphate synthase subunit HisF [Deltaproteobacteria bacterium]
MRLLRVIPCLLLRGTGLVKTVRFKDPSYVGDPRNAVKIFNEKEVDELLLLDIGATAAAAEPNFGLISEVASECFMPFGYGGGIRRLVQAERILKLGAEKICINTAAVEQPRLIAQAAQRLGTQSIVASIDVKSGPRGEYEVLVRNGAKSTGLDPVAHAQRMEEAGAGEILLNAIDRDGTMTGYDLELVRRVSGAVRVPVVACGGAGSVADLAAAVTRGGAAAAAAGSLFVFHGRHRAVLISFPERSALEAAWQGECA